MKDKKNNPSTQIRIELASRANCYNDFVKYDEDKKILDYCLVHNSKINSNNDVVLQCNNM